MKKHYCPKCDKFVKSEVKKIKETYPVMELKTITIIANVRHCKVCGSQMFDQVLDSANMERVYRKAGVWREVKRRHNERKIRS